MADYYADSVLGLDTNDGSEEAPWKTLHKSLTHGVIPDAAGHRLVLAAGIYAENSGSGYLNINTNRTNELEIVSATGDPADVIVRGASSDTYNVLFASSATTAQIKFVDLTFDNRASTSLYTISFHANSITNDITFSGCKFLTYVGTASKAHRTIYAVANNLKGHTRLKFDACEFAVSGGLASGESVINLVLQRPNTTTTAILDALTITDCYSSSPGQGWLIEGATGQTVTDNIVVGGTGVAMTFGADAYSAGSQPSTGSVLRNQVTGGTSHALLIGSGCDGLIVENNRAIGGDYSLVVKNTHDCLIRGNLALGSSVTNYAIYDKASDGTVFSGNMAVCVKSGGYSFYAGEDATGGTKYVGGVVRGNTLIARNGALLERFNATEETGTTILVDNNTLLQLGSGAFGTIDGSNAADIAALRTLWDAYGGGTHANDDSSVVGDPSFYSALGFVGGGSRMGIGL